MNSNRIITNLDNPEELEKYYREQRRAFTTEFFQAYPLIAQEKIAGYWKYRIEYDAPGRALEKSTRFERKDVLMLIVSCALASFLIKLPDILNINLQSFSFYEKNAALIVLLGLSVYTLLTKEAPKTKHLLIALGGFVGSAIYMNLLPSSPDSHSIILAYIHLPLVLWCLFGLIVIDFDFRNKARRMDFIRYNGDLAVLGALILIAGMALAMVTLGLFMAIDIEIENFYMNYVGIWGLVSAPVLTAFIIRNFPAITHRIAPVIASIFSPLVLITLVIYLVSIPLAGKDPYNDRDFLLIFNLMLLGVMAIIVFSVSETSLGSKQQFHKMILFALVAVTLIIDAVALSAILYRLGEYGLTPNRAAVLGSNLLIFGNLIMIMIDLYKVNVKNRDISLVETTISGYLPIYVAWVVIVAFGFPFLFGFR
ncbi:MAG: hypothetical protein R6U64_10325 [Bacteroidales bacterium]